MKDLTKDTILSITGDLKTKVIPIPEWAGQVTIREMSGRLRDRFEKIIMDDKLRNGVADMKSWLVAHSVVNQDGTLMFTEDDIVKLSEKSSSALLRLTNEIKKINGLVPGAIEDEIKN